MYHECLSCHKLGVSCDGPNLFALSSREILEWCKKRKSKLQLSNAKLAELSGTPKGTIDRIFAGDSDFKHETIRPIVRALIGGDFSGDPCGTDDTAKLEAENARLLRELDLTNRLLAEKERHMREHNPFNYTLLGLCIVVVLMLGTYMMLDLTNPYFGLVQHDGTSPLIYAVVVAVVFTLLFACVYGMREWNKRKKK